MIAGYIDELHFASESMMLRRICPDIFEMNRPVVFSVNQHKFAPVIPRFQAVRFEYCINLRVRMICIVYKRIRKQVVRLVGEILIRMTLSVEINGQLRRVWLFQQASDIQIGVAVLFIPVNSKR